MAEADPVRAGPRPWQPAPDAQRVLEGLDSVLETTIDTGEEQLRAMALHLIRRGGKRLRPALLLTAAQFGESRDEHLAQAAAAIELIHVASLYHDDVMDRAPMRRGGPSANARWGNAQAAVAGTYLFARGCALLSALGDAANRMASEASADLCAGQLQELEHAYDLTLGEAEHRAILRRKTATLFALPCRLGALLSAAPPEAARALARYGTHLGLAFQLADDALDLRGQASRLGKATGTDLREGVYSLAVLRALEHEAEAECEAEAPANEAPANEAPANEAPAGGGSSGQEQPLREQPLREQPLREQPLREQPLRELLGRARLGEAEVAAVRARVVASGAVEEALAAAGEEARRAQEALAGLAAGPARRALHRLAVYAVERSS